MQRPSFGVVTSVVTALVVVGVAARKLRPAIPAIASNAMVKERENFLRAGRFQPIQWRRMSTAAFADAKRTKRPLLIFIGTVASELARQIDAGLGDPEVARIIGQRFICIRIDAMEHPEWANAFLPVERLRMRFEPDAQLWAVDPSGRPFQLIGRTDASQSFDRTALETLLTDAIHRFGDIRKNPEASAAAADAQVADLETIRRPAPQGPPNLKGYAQSLVGEIDATHGGFVNRGIHSLLPHAHRFLLATGKDSFARTELEGLLASPMLDVVDGGFFHRATGTDPWRVEPDRWAMECADMAHTFALAYALLGRARYLRESRRALDTIERTLMVNGQLMSAELGQTDARGRSLRHSFPPRALAERIGQTDFDWAEDHLALDVSSNPQAIPYIESLEIAPATLDAVLTKISTTRPDPPVFSGVATSDVQLSCIARSIQSARLLGDGNRTHRGLGHLFDAVSRYRIGPDVRHRPGEKAGNLGDYLAYADARLQEFLVTGQRAALDDGLVVLRRTVARFRKGPGQFCLTDSVVHGTPAIALPELADNLGESGTARAARILLSYGRLLADHPEGLALRQEARLTGLRYVEVARSGGSLAAGYLCAVAEMMDRRYALCTGPDAIRLAQELGRICAARFVAPAIPGIREDLRARGDGIFIVDGDKVDGPFSMAETMKRLPPTFRPTP